jgi:hypothetical protein
MQANKMIDSQWSFDTYLKLFKELSDQFNKIQVNHIYAERNMMQSKPLFGRPAFDLIINKKNSESAYNHDIFLELTLVVEEYIYISSVVRKTDFSQKHFIIYKMLRFYHINLQFLSAKLEQKFHNTAEPTTFEKVPQLFLALEGEVKKLEAAFD